MQLSQKERLLLEDLKSQEEICVVKYQSYAKLAEKSIKSIMYNFGGRTKHYDTVNQITG